MLSSAQIKLDQHLVADFVIALKRFNLVVTEHLEATCVEVLFAGRDFFSEKVEFAGIFLADLLNVANVCDSCFKFHVGVV